MRKHRLHRKWTRLVAFGAVAAVVLAIATPAHAGGIGGGVLSTPNWKVCVSGVQDLHEAMAYAVKLINSTDVNAVFVDCHSGEANVISFATNSSGDWYGESVCLTFGADGRCTSKSIQFNTRKNTTRTQWFKTACHELGHVAGLGHRTEDFSCMKQGEAPPISATFDPLDKQAIDATY